MVMRRDADALCQPFDILIIGAGIYGAVIARLAALRGWSVALIDKGDFGSATSRNSAKIIHGGLRYIQHFDFRRVRESAIAQREWRIAAPHLVQPLRFVIPTYGAGTRGRAALMAGVLAYEIATADRNRDVLASVKLPRAGIMGRREMLRQLPMLDGANITGGAYWYDAQMLDATRLTLEHIEDAHRAGAIIANHVEATRLLTHRGAVYGAEIRDRLTDRVIDVSARVTVNTTGPWIGGLVPRPHSPAARSSLGARQRHASVPPLSRAVNLVTRPIIGSGDAFGIYSDRPSDAALGHSRRLFFVSPWQDCSVIGTWHDPYTGDPDEVHVTRKEVEQLVAEINRALPSAELSLADIRSVHVGLTPGSDETGGRARRSSFIDHGAADGLGGLLSIAGVKFTTAPTVARRVVQRVGEILGAPTKIRWASPSRSAGGEVAIEGAQVREIPAIAQDDPAVKWACRVYGSRCVELLNTVPARGLPSEEHVFRCRVLHGIRNEMVVKLRDAIFRATDHAERGCLTDAQLLWCADTLKSAFGWSASRRAAEIEEVRALRQMDRPISAVGSFR